MSGGSFRASLSPRSSCSCPQGGTGRLPTRYRARSQPAEVAWLQRALDGWEQVSRQFLRIDPSPLAVDRPLRRLLRLASVARRQSRPPTPIRSTTTLTFAGSPVPVRALSHKGTVLLPSGAPVAVEMKASTSLYRNSRGAFFVMAMPSVWQTKDVSAPTRAEYLQGVFSHEMTHTRLLVGINRRVRELARKNDLVYPINDDVIQAEFRRTHGFEAAVNRERDQFYRAALEPDPAAAARR